VSRGRDFSEERLLSTIVLGLLFVREVLSAREFSDLGLRGKGKAVSQVPGSDFAKEAPRRIGRSLSCLCLTSVLAISSFARAQATPAPATNSVRNDKPPAAAVNPSTPTPAVPTSVVPDAVAPTPPTAEQTPPQPPAVTWDGNLLTIDAENSTLAAVLVALRTQTGASIEIPSAASRERVFVHLGPGQVREIISSLLYGTEFDYIVETSDDDPDALRSVAVTARGKGDDSTVGALADASDAVAAGGSNSDVAAKGFRSDASQGVGRPGGMRMMRGWAAPGKPTFQADAEAAIAAEEAARESNSASDTADANAQNPHPSGAESPAGSQEASTSDAESASSAAPSRATANSITESDIPPETASSASSTSDSNDQTGISKSIQNMTRMFEQRRQIQAQQNKAAQSQQQSPAN
jgi:hypothetical protein